MYEERTLPNGISANTLGQVKLPIREAPMPRGGVRKYYPKWTYGAVKPYKNNTQDKLVLTSMSKHLYGARNLVVARLVCEAFHGPPPEGKPNVLHIDENSMNNKPENLKWGSQKENLNAPGFIEYCKGRTGENSPIIKGMRKRA